MSNYRLSSVAEAQLDDIWWHIARDSGSVDTATRIATVGTPINAAIRGPK